MKGLNAYTLRYGNHFTEKLVEEVINPRWSTLEIERYSRNLVYYNVSRATIGDIVFLVNYCHIKNKTSKAKSIRYALEVIGDFSKEGYAFGLWLADNKNSNTDLRYYL